MGTEIERKFLVVGDTWRTGMPGVRYRQGYLTVGPPVAVRVRIADGSAMLNIKKATLALRRDEFEYAIPVEDAEVVLDRLCDGHIIEKTRYKVPFDDMTWEIDVFEGANAGLVLAELEIDDEDRSFARPPWLGLEVSGDPRYLNTSLSLCPFSTW